MADNINTQTTTDDEFPTALVHKAGEEGALELFADGDRIGMVKNPADSPPWANGLILAKLDEHMRHYHLRVGPDYAPPEVYNADDLEWLCLDEDGEATTIEANPEVRAERLAEVLNLDLSDIEVAHSRETRNLVTSVIVDMDEVRTRAEADALLVSQSEGAAAFRTGT